MMTEILFLGYKLLKVNMMAEIPGRATLPGFSKTPERQWSPDPINEKGWQSGKHSLRLEFIDSPRTTLVIGNPSNRTIRVGNQRQVQCGGYASYVNLTQDFRGLEESQELHLGHRLKHFRGLKPLVLKKARDKWGSNSQDLEDQVLKQPLTQKPKKGFLKGFFNTTDDLVGGRSLAYSLELDKGKKHPEQDDRDEIRDDKMHRGQEWNRYETVWRLEAVGMDMNSVLTDDGNFVDMLQSPPKYSQGTMKNALNRTPSLSPDSPQALLEVRAKEFSNIGKESTSANTASVICAAPTFVLCGMKNPNDYIGKDSKNLAGDQLSYHSEASAYEWLKGGEEEAEADNFFAIRNKKDLSKNWSDIQPVLDPILPIADYGIFGCEKINYNNMTYSGMELFGREALILGSGAKMANKEEWKSSLFLGENHLKLSNKVVGDDGETKKDSRILMDNYKISIRAVDTKSRNEGVLDIMSELIDLTVTGPKGITGLTIKEGELTIWVNGERVHVFNKDGSRDTRTDTIFRV
jgi:hypothetical protein